MKRRQFLKQAAVAATAGTALACGGPSESGAGGGPTTSTAPERETIRWRLVSSFPRALDTIYGASETLADELDRLSDGRFKLRCYPPGEIVPGLQVLDAVQQGTVEVGQSASYYYTGKNPAFAFDTAVPFGLSARQQAAWLLEGGGQELMRPLFSDFGVLQFYAGSTGAQMGGWFNKALDTPDDIKGLKMRIPGQGGDVMSRLGATVQVLSGGDIYPALERGAIDATEWIGPYDDEKLGFNKVAKYYYYPGWWEPGPALSFYVSKPAWEKLPKDFQAMFEVASERAALRMQAKYDAKNPLAMARLKQSGVDFRPFSPAIMQAARDETNTLLAELSEKDATFRKIYEEWSRFKAQSFEWFGTAELAYAQFSFGGAQTAS